MQFTQHFTLMNSPLCALNSLAYKTVFHSSLIFILVRKDKLDICLFLLINYVNPFLFVYFLIDSTLFMFFSLE